MTADQVFDCEKFLFLPWMKWNPSFANKYESVGLKIFTFWRHYNLYKQGLKLRIFSTIGILVFMPYIWLSSYIIPWSMFINAMYLSLKTNDFHPLTMTKVYSEKYHKIYMWLIIFRKMLRTLLLARLYESKNVNVMVIAHRIFRPWKEDVLVDIDAFDKYKQFLVSIWPQSQVTKPTLFYNFSILWSFYN